MDKARLTRLREIAASVRPQALAGVVPVQRDWYKVSALSGGTVEIYIYDLIGDWGVSASAFARELVDIRADQINVRLNSQGGDAWDGVAIYNALRTHPARCEVYVDGIAASAASVIAMAGERVVMRRGTRMMVHDASMVAWGNAAMMREAAEILDGISDDIAGLYAAKAGGTAEQWRERMRGGGKNDGTWYSAEESVAAKLADETDYSDGDDGGDGGVVPEGPEEANPLDALRGWAEAIPAPTANGGTIEQEIDYAEIGQSVLAAMREEAR